MSAVEIIKVINVYLVPLLLLWQIQVLTTALRLNNGKELILGCGAYVPLWLAALAALSFDAAWVSVGLLIVVLLFALSIWLMQSTGQQHGVRSMGTPAHFALVLVLLQYGVGLFVLLALGLAAAVRAILE